MSLGRLLDVFIIFKNKFSFNKIILSVRDVLPSFPHLCLVSEEASMKDAGEAGIEPEATEQHAADLHLLLFILKCSFLHYSQP
jgi:hypothetical protein